MAVIILHKISLQAGSRKDKQLLTLTGVKPPELIINWLANN